MNLKSLAMGGCLLLATVLPTQAQSIDGSQVDEILNIARGYGAANLQAQANGDPWISGKLDGTPYHVFFMNCTDNTACEDIYFYAGFLDNHPSLEAINDWNREKRFGKAYIDAEDDAVIEFDVNLVHGVSRKNLDATFAVWTAVLGQFATHIGHK